MSRKELARDDLIGRYAGHTFTETVDGSMTLVEFKTAGDVLVAHAQTLDVDDAYVLIREKLGLTDSLEILTTVERDAITPNEGKLIINSTTGALSFYLRDSWR